MLSELTCGRLICKLFFLLYILRQECAKLKKKNMTFWYSEVNYCLIYANAIFIFDKNGMINNFKTIVDVPKIAHLVLWFVLILSFLAYFNDVPILNYRRTGTHTADIIYPSMHLVIAGIQMDIIWDSDWIREREILMSRTFVMIRQWLFISDQ